MAVMALAGAWVRAAALVPVPTTAAPAFPALGLEANKGQAKAGVLFLSLSSRGGIAVTAQWGRS